MQRDLVIPLPLESTPLPGSETKSQTQTDSLGRVQVRICADSVCSLQVSVMAIQHDAEPRSNLTARSIV